MISNPDIRVLPHTTHASTPYLTLQYTPSLNQSHLFHSSKHSATCKPSNHHPVSNTQQVNMSLDSVWYSRPRIYGKGSRGWFVSSSPHLTSTYYLAENTVQCRNRRQEEIRYHPQIRTQYESSGVPGEGAGYWVRQGMFHAERGMGRGMGADDVQYR